MDNFSKMPQILEGKQSWSFSSSSFSISRYSRVPEVSKLSNPLAADKDEYYELIVYWGGKVHLYRITSDRVTPIPSSKAYTMVGIEWKELPEFVKIQVALDLFSQISEKDWVHDNAQGNTSNFIEEEDFKWAEEHCICNEFVTIIIAKVLGYRFSTQRICRKYKNAPNSTCCEQEYIIDEKWVLVVREEVCGDVNFEIINSENFEDERLIMQLMADYKISREIAYIAACMEERERFTFIFNVNAFRNIKISKEKMEIYLAIICNQKGRRLPKERIKVDMLSEARSEFIKYCCGTSIYEKYIKNIVDEGTIMDYIVQG